jgi:hypothetical protein
MQKNSLLDCEKDFQVFAVYLICDLENLGLEGSRRIFPPRKTSDCEIAKNLIICLATRAPSSSEFSGVSKFCSFALFGEKIYPQSCP